MIYDKKKIESAAEMAALVDEAGFLPLLNIDGCRLSVEALAADEAQYMKLPEGGWEWPLWMWKGSVIRLTGAAYGSFFNGHSGFVSREWWPCFSRWRRRMYPQPAPGSIDEMVLDTLRSQGPMVARELRKTMGFTGKNDRSRFDSTIRRLQMATLVVTEDFVYPMDRHGQMYGWGLALLTVPERLFGADMMADCTADDAFKRMAHYLYLLMPDLSPRYINRVFIGHA